MEINKKYSISRDANNFIVETWGVKKEGENKGDRFISERKYYLRLDQACETILRKSIDVTSMETIIHTIHNANEDISKMCKGIMKKFD